MPEETYDLLRRALLQALGPRPSPERRRQVAADLRALAEQQERMAARDTDRPAAEARTPARPAGHYVRIGREQDPGTGTIRLRLSLGRAIWSELGAPERIDVQRTGAELWVVPVRAGGYPLAASASLPNCVIAGPGPLDTLASGRYAASIRAGAIVIGERVG